MRIITSVLKTAAAGALVAALWIPAHADDEKFPDGTKPDDGEALPGSEEAANEEEDVDVLGELEKIIGKMKDAESSLAQAGSWKATDAQGKAIEEADKFLKAKDLQEKAIREMTKIFDGSKDGQSQAIAGIEKLIKAAKDQQGQGQPNSQKKDGQKKQQQPKNQNPNKPNNPAQQPYNPSGNNDDGSPRDRAADLTDKWGNLPDRLRDEISQADDEFRTTRGTYREKLMEYSRLMGSTE